MWLVSLGVLTQPPRPLNAKGFGLIVMLMPPGHAKEGLVGLKLVGFRHDVGEFIHECCASEGSDCKYLSPASGCLVNKLPKP